MDRIERKPMSEPYSGASLVGDPLPSTLVALSISSTCASWIAFVIYACTEDPFWWQAGLRSTVLAAIWTGSAALLAGLRARTTNETREPRAEGFVAWAQVGALACALLSLVLHRDAWGSVPDVTRPLVSGDVEVIVLPDPSLAVILAGLALLATLFAGLGPWKVRGTGWFGAATPEHARPSLRPSRDSLIQT